MPIKQTGAFTYWVKQTLPSIYSDSLSYIETLDKVVEFLNSVIEQNNAVTDYVESNVGIQDGKIKDLRDEFQLFIDRIENDILPENIEIILDEWFDSGRLAEIINLQVFELINSNIDLLGYDITKRGAIGDGVFDNRAIIQTMLTEGHTNLYIPDGTFLINNLLVPLIVDNKNVKITGTGTLKALHHGIDLLVVKETGSTIERITLEGNGNIIENNEGEEKVALLKYDGRALYKRMNFECENVNFLEPHTVSLQGYNAVGGKIEDNHFFSSRNETNLTTTFTMHVLLSGCAYIDVIHNDTDGMAQGISGSGFSTATQFNDFAGVLSNKTRHINMERNTHKNHFDHANYFSDECEHLRFHKNHCDSRTDGIKVEGGHISITGNWIAEGLSGRNVHDILIDDNEIVVTASTPYVFGILLGTAVFKRNTENVKITNNTLKHMGGESHTGIWIKGEVWDGFQNRLKNILIKDNTVIGFGNRSTGSSIHIDQVLPMSGGFVEDSVGRTIMIIDNILETSDVSGLDNYSIKLNNLENVTMTGNTGRGMTQTGAFLMGVRKLITDNNRFTFSAVAGFTKTGILERPNDLTVHINSELNNYGADEFIGAGSEVIWANENSKRLVKKTVKLVGASSQTLRPYHNTGRVFKSVSATGHSYTLGNLTTSPFSLGDVIEIFNYGTIAFNVEPQGLVLAGGERVYAYHDGAGVFTYIKK